MAQRCGVPLYVISVIFALNYYSAILYAHHSHQERRDRTLSACTVHLCIRQEYRLCDGEHKHIVAVERAANLLWTR
jgi:hypothetical protein